MQKAADLSAIIARLNSIKATASPAEAARIEAELPQLQRGQQNLQAGIEHLNSFADQAGAVANNATDDYQIAAYDTEHVASSATGVVRGSIRPKTNGSWSNPNAVGDSNWHSTRSDVNAITGNQPIPFRNNFPDLSQWVYVENGVRGEVTLAGFTTRNADVSAADDAYAIVRGWLKRDGTPDRGRVVKLREDDGLTWHHHEDRRTMQLVPTALNKIPHQGGFSLSH